MTVLFLLILLSSILVYKLIHNLSSTLRLITSSIKKLSVGEIIENQKYIGGAPLNFAAHIVKCGGSSSVISGVGDDELGRLALEYVHKLEVDASAVFSVPYRERFGRASWLL